MTDPPLVELRHVAKTFPNGVAALSDFTISINEGEFVSLLGPSGCGKSTALRIIAGLTPATLGSIGLAWNDGPSNRRRSPPLACVFQEPTLLPWASVWKNVYLPLRLRGVSKASAREHVDEAIELVGLEEFADAHPRELSGGMKMRTSVARALVTQPRLLLLDEPFAALDEITRTRLNDDLLAIRRRRGWAALFITHSVYEAVYLSTRVLVMSPLPGRVVAEIPIDLPELRTAETRLTPRYLELCRRTSEALQISLDHREAELA